MAKKITVGISFSLSRIRDFWCCLLLCFYFTLLSDGFTPRKTFLEGGKKNATMNSETVFKPKNCTFTYWVNQVKKRKQTLRTHLWLSLFSHFSILLVAKPGWSCLLNIVQISSLLPPSLLMTESLSSHLDPCSSLLLGLPISPHFQSLAHIVSRV